MGWFNDFKGLAGCFWNFLVLRRGRISSMPLEASVEVTNVCNFRCDFCPQSDKAHLERMGRNYLTPESADTILQGIRRMGYNRTTLHWTLDGEPFMNKQFSRISEVALKYGFTNQYFATNMFLVTADRARTLSRDVRYGFTVDYCADQAYFEDFRGSPGAWEKVRENITAILEAEDLRHISFFIADISSYGIADQRVLREKMKNLVDLFPRSGRIRFAPKTFHNATGDIELKTARAKSRIYHKCPYPWTSLTIAANGDVMPCCRDLRHKTVLGNVLTDSPAEVWNNHAFVSFRENILSKNPQLNAACKDCDMPYDSSKFSIGNLIRTIRNRFQVGQ